MTTLKNIKSIQLFSHNDLDGISPSLLLEKRYPNKEFNASFYNNDEIDSGIEKYLKENKDLNEAIFITDITIKEKTANMLNQRHKKGQKIFYFDHHKTSLFLTEKFKWATVSVTLDGRKTCATELLFRFLISNHPSDEIYTKYFTNYVEQVRLYDTWDWFKYDNRTPVEINDLYYIVGFSSFRSLIFDVLDTFNGKIKYTAKVKTLLSADKYRKESYFKEKEKTVFSTFLEGYEIGVVFAESYHSELGNYLAEKYKQYDLITIVNISENKLSFRTIKENIDVSDLAKLFGGGGHKAAAGATLTKDLYKVFVLPNAN